MNFILSSNNRNAISSSFTRKVRSNRRENCLKLISTDVDFGMPLQCFFLVG